jgi:hypothetical protein
MPEGIPLLAVAMDPFYLSGLILGGFLIFLLIAREFLDITSDARLQRWERAIRFVSVPLTLLFVVTVAAHIAG